MSQTRLSSSLLQFLLIFAAVYLGSQLLLQQFFPDQFGPESQLEGVIVQLQDDTVKGGHHPTFVIKNKTSEDLILPDRCPLPPVEVSFTSGDNQPPLPEDIDTVLPCRPLTTVSAGSSVTYDLSPWKYALFDQFGEYELTLPVEDTSLSAEDAAQYADTQLSATLEIYPAGTITQLFRTFVSKPLFNLLVFIASQLPGHSLGWAVILLTILVKVVLFFPTQHAMEGQRKLQAIQPQTEELRKKHKDDPKKLQEETMKLWRKHKVNPMQSCLPTLIQFPVLIGLYFAIRDGAVFELSRHLLYDFYLTLDWTFTTTWFGLDLLRPNLYVLPPLLMVMQFLQMKLAFAISNKKKASKEGKKSKKAGEKVLGNMSQQELQQKMMLYGLPIMIGVFAVQFPAAVSLYWGVSTVFAIGQQLVVNRKEL